MSTKKQSWLGLDTLESRSYELERTSASSFLLENSSKLESDWSLKQKQGQQGTEELLRWEEFLNTNQVIKGTHVWPGPEYLSDNRKEKKKGRDHPKRLWNDPFLKVGGSQGDVEFFSWYFLLLCSLSFLWLVLGLSLLFCQLCLSSLWPHTVIALSFCHVNFSR